MNSDFIQKTILFKGINETELKTALKQLQAKEKCYQKDEAILLAGNQTKRMGLVLSGSVTVENNDMWGNRTILSHIETGQFFAETYAFLENEPLMVDVIANEACSILFLNIDCLHSVNAASEAWMIKFLANLLTISAHKNLTLSNRSFHTAPKTIRGRVMSYLNAAALRAGSREFDIPFDRQQLADYLNLERSALSKELGKMQRDGLIQVRKSHFVICN